MSTKIFLLSDVKYSIVGAAFRTRAGAEDYARSKIPDGADPDDRNVEAWFRIEEIELKD